MTGPEPDAEPVLGRVTAEPYDPDAAAAFEVTRQLLMRVLAVHSARRWDLEHAEQADPDALRRTVAAQAETAELLKTLDVRDPERVARVRADCVALLREAGQR